MNHLSGTDRLANRFRVMRHGQSKANEAGIIVAAIESDRRGDYGLSELGLRQARAAADACGLPADTVICSSDFARARQTAEIVRARLGAAEVTVAEALRERGFGDLEGATVASYARVWEADETDKAHVAHEAGDAHDAHAAHAAHAADEAGADGAGAGRALGVEPAAAVLDRVTALVAGLERRYSGRDILLVSHGDTLQILEAGFLRLDPTRHRRLPPLATAEIRELRLAGEPSRPRS
jgi:broad specificity phosphatase PhoE